MDGRFSAQAVGSQDIRTKYVSLSVKSRAFTNMNATGEFSNEIKAPQFRSNMGQSTAVSLKLLAGRDNKKKKRGINYRIAGICLSIFPPTDPRQTIPSRNAELIGLFGWMSHGST